MTVGARAPRLRIVGATAALGAAVAVALHSSLKALPPGNRGRAAPGSGGALLQTLTPATTGATTAGVVPRDLAQTIAGEGGLVALPVPGAA